MAQLEGMRSRHGDNQKSPAMGSCTNKYADNPKTPINTRFAHYNPKSPTTMATIEQLLQGSGGGGREGYTKWHSSTSPTAPSNSNTSSPGSRRHYDQEDPTPVLKKSPSVISRVKEKAKKWRRTLSSKKKPTTSPLAPSPTLAPTPSWGNDDQEYQEEDPEYLGAPMYESELAPESYKETARQHPRAVHVVSEKNVLVSSECSTEPMQTRDQTPENADHEKQAEASSVVADGGSEIHTPPCETEAEAEAEATEEVTRKIEDLSVAAPCPARIATTEQTSSPGDQVWDKGVSVKQYLMHKLEPGDDEKALSQMISDAISPRISAANVGVVEKVKVAVNSLLGTDQVSLSAAPDTSAPNPSSDIPASTNDHEVVEEENNGRVLQAN